MVTWLQKALQSTESLTGLVEGMYQLARRRPAQYKSGPLQIRGLHEAVDILIDTFGVPHIYAQNEDDLYLAQGYIHARERLWQMEFNRRLAAGRLSEIFGTVALETDRFCRRLGMHRAAAAEALNLDAHNRRILEAYARGINTFIQQNIDHLPIEFRLLHLKPEPWQPADTIQWGKLQSWGLSGNWESEIIRAHLVANLGPERAARLESGYDPDHPLIIPPGTTYQGINTGLLEQYEQIKTLSGFSSLGGSNNWVVDGTLTATGRPILCNDPHLGQGIPSIWFECHLNDNDLDVIGASFPGSPGIIIGHNQQIAWGVTNAVSDVQDLYIEKFSADNPHTYEFQGEWLSAEIIREEIIVKDQDLPVVEEVRITRHGPIITQLPQIAQAHTENVEELPLALRWNAFEAGTLLTAVYGINRATDWSSFLDALHSWDTPPQNFVYADIDGNIGYIMAGRIPIRAQGQGLLPVPGWTSEYEWTGYIPFAELPQSYNPEQHLLVTANNRVVGDNYPYYISHEWCNGYRAQRIQDLLQSKQQLTLDDMAEIQTDQYSLPAVEIVPFILQRPADTPLKRAAHDILHSWNFILEPDSIAASIYTTFLSLLQSIVLSAIIGTNEEILSNYLGSGIHTLNPINGYAGRSKPLLIRLLKAYDNSWFADNAIPNGPTSWDSALDRAFAGCLDELQVRAGQNILHWQYGRIHNVQYNHPLGVVKTLEPFLNRGPFPWGGDADTVNVACSSPKEPKTILTVPSYRQIVDLETLTNSRAIHAPGQSGDPGSKHYDDFLPLWQKGKHHPMLFTRASIEEALELSLQMYPKGDLEKIQ